MKNIANITGVVLIVVGVLLLSYQGFQYTQTERIAKIGDIEVTANVPKRLDFPPLLAGISIIGGIVILAIGKINKK